MPKPSNRFPETTVIPPGGKRHQRPGTLAGLISELCNHRAIGPCIAHVEKLPAQPARYGEWPENLAPRLRDALAERGAKQPYIHQAEAIRLANDQRDLVVVTPTASGKSLCYNVPVVQSLLENPESRALYLFPTKALSHDQYAEIYELTRRCSEEIKVFTYDGDTPPATRRSLRDAGNLIVTNPDMLHAGILPHHTKWVRLFENLKYIILDELHQYRGIFGSHLANVIARLLRLCRFYGSQPVFLCSSATIANPGELAERLTGRQFTVLKESGAPLGEKTFLFYNPPVINRELNVRRSARLEAPKLALRFLSRDHQVITFARSRMDVEVVTTYLKRGMRRLNRDPETVTGYRGGYLPTERRAIEGGLKKKELLGVVSTNALELGVDIGSLDVSILCGYPGTISSAWQQAGRAGRKAKESLVIYIAGSSALDQFLINHPTFFFGQPPESAIVNPENLAILANHLKCGSFELPFHDGETFGSVDPGPLLQYLEDEKILRHSGERWHYSADSYPADEVSLRKGISENFIVLDTGRDNKVIAEVDFESAPFFIHDDAIYIHNSKTYIVEKLDWDRRTAYVRHKIVDYYTDAESSSNVQVLAVDEEAPGPGAQSVIEQISFGEVSVATVITRFKKVKFESQESIGYGPVSLPQMEVQTEAAWFTFSQELSARWKAEGRELGSALRALARLLRHTAALFVLCDPRDFSTHATLRSPFDQAPAIFLWDRYPGGIGIARRFYSIAAKSLKSARSIIEECACEHGCPSCTGPPLEGDERIKENTRILLDQILGAK